jgi:hypothetical protein
MASTAATTTSRFVMTGSFSPRRHYEGGPAESQPAHKPAHVFHAKAAEDNLLHLQPSWAYNAPHK